MADRSTISQGVQIGVETTSGTAVAANKKLLGTSIEPSAKVSVKTYRPSGGKFSTITALGKEWAEAKINGPLTYTDIVYLLSGNVAFLAPVQQGATTAYLWTHTPGQSAEDTIKTFTVEQGSGVRAHRAPYGLVNSFGYSITRDEAMIKGSMLMKPIEDGITLTATPTPVPLIPVLPTQVSLYNDPTAAALGTTKLTRGFSVDWEFSSRFLGVWPIDAAISGFAAHVETEPKPTFKVLLEADTAGMGFLAHVRQGTRSFFRVEAEGALIDTGHNYLFQHDISAECVDVGEFKDEGGVYALEYTFQAIFDATWGKAFEFQVKNGLATL